MTTDRPIIDYDRSIDLDDAWTAAVCITVDGDDVLWLLGPDDDAGCACRNCAPHEQDHSVHFRCVAVTKSGARCRARVSTPDGLCGPHVTWPPDRIVARAELYERRSHV